MIRLPLLALLLVSALWGSHPVVGKLVEHQLPPLPLTVWRFTFGAMLYLPLFKKLPAIIRLPRRQFWLLALSGLAWAVLYPLFYYQSLRILSPIESLLLVNTSPLIAALFAFFALRERLRPMEWLGIAVSFMGVVILVAGKWGGQASMVGLLIALLAAVAFAAYTVASKSLFQELPLFDVLVGTSVWGSLFLWIYVAVTGQAVSVVQALAPLSVAGWLQFLYIVIIVSTLAYVLYGYGLRNVPAGIASAVTFYPQALFAALIQWLWLDIAPGLITLVSAVFILGGTLLMRLKSKGSQTAAPPEPIREHRQR